MWPVAIKKDVEMFFGFMGYSESTRKVVTDVLGEWVARGREMPVSPSICQHA
jgi:hypothetical protein